MYTNIVIPTIVIYTLSLHDALPILGNFKDPVGGGNPSAVGGLSQLQRDFRIPSNLNASQFTSLGLPVTEVDPHLNAFRQSRSEEHTSELQSLRHLVCRLLLEKKNVI